MKDLLVSIKCLYHERVISNSIKFLKKLRENGRKKRKIRMVKKGKNKNEWLVEGKNQPLYRVSKNDGWICECKAFEFRKSDDYECKHILEVKMFERQGGKNL